MRDAPAGIAVREESAASLAACRLYGRQGCVLGAIHRHARPALPDEARLLRYRALDAEAGPG